MVWQHQKQSLDLYVANCFVICQITKQVPTYKSTRLPHRHGVHHPRSNIRIFIMGPKRKGSTERETHTPRTVPLNVPPGKYGPDRIRTHTLTVHRNSSQRTSTGRVLARAEGYVHSSTRRLSPGVEQHLSNATPHLRPKFNFTAKSAAKKRSNEILRAREQDLRGGLFRARPRVARIDER
jgi:hypothetical protein